MNSKKILIIAPHADDEILGCGGVISREYRHSDIHVVVVCNRVTEVEDKESCYELEKKYNIRYSFLNYRDEYLDMVPVSQIIKKIEAIYLDIHPDSVYIPFFGDINNDHAIVHRACTIAFRKIQQRQPKELFTYEVPSSTTQGIDTFSPNTFIELNISNVLDKYKMLSYFKNEVRDYPNPRSKRGITTYARFRGMECNRKYAEAFICIYKIE
jgi:LmbE family N-acetylglucosaminyl deacetylase